MSRQVPGSLWPSHNYNRTSRFVHFRDDLRMLRKIPWYFRGITRNVLSPCSLNLFSNHWSRVFGNVEIRKSTIHSLFWSVYKQFLSGMNLIHMPSNHSPIAQHYFIRKWSSHSRYMSRNPFRSIRKVPSKYWISNTKFRSRAFLSW